MKLPLHHFEFLMPLKKKSKEKQGVTCLVGVVDSNYQGGINNSD
jgi:dUTPase